ncbi:MAG: hypothetical protein FJY29_04130 [Betaproteobacteria bacterium]|nr:hypothetical protein [Betaproteobacteria bacterium]
MIASFIKIILRIAILALVILPVVVPFLEKSIDRQPPARLTVWIDANLPRSDTDEKKAEQRLRDKLSLDRDVLIGFRTWGSATQTPLEDYEELLAYLKTATGPQVIVGQANLWGAGARNFRRSVEQLTENKASMLLMMRPEELGWKQRSNTPERYLVLSDLSAPQLNFLGEPTQLSLDIVGRLQPQEKQNFEVVVRSGESVLASQPVSVQADANGVVNTIENIPVYFTRAQQQLLTAELTSELSPVPLNMASTAISVVHSKTTVLHVGVGPDWSMRQLRSKLKFWPNLDLLSYYILREVNDDLSIPSNQLSLIEFPSEKLFGQQLPNFHGVLAQNFAFDTYLNSRDAQHLFEYVSANGGRMVLQAGALSFLARDSNIRDLMPCENVPTFDFENEHRWQAGKSRLMAEPQFETAVSSIVTKQTALGCKPKPGALVLAQTADESRSPVVIAYPVGKGLVLAFLAGDWHTSSTQREATTAVQRANRVASLDASEFLVQWMVEFLQRRQDSGLRPPQFAGPRIYRDDPLHAVRSRGGLPARALLQGRGESFGAKIASPVWLAHLDVEAIKWQQSIGARLNSGTPPSGILPGSDATLAPRFEPLGLNWQMSEASLGAPAGHTPRALVWPVLEGTSRTRETLPNPTLFPQELFKASGDFVSSLKKINEFREQRMIPILEAYPWLLALALALLALEQLLGRLRSAPAIHAAPAAIKSQQKNNS